MKTAEEIVRSLASETPFVSVGTGVDCCMVCGSNVREGVGATDHKENCPYVAAKEWVGRERSSKIKFGPQLHGPSNAHTAQALALAAELDCDPPLGIGVEREPETAERSDELRKRRERWERFQEDVRRLYASAAPAAPALLDLCRAFDSIDLSECNRRLEAGEKFDADCDAAMEKRQALGEQIKERLGVVWPEFEKSHEELATKFPASSKLAEHALADVTTEAMKDVRSFFMFGALASRASCDVPIDDCQTDFFGMAIHAMRRLMVLAKAFGIEARP